MLHKTDWWLGVFFKIEIYQRTPTLKLSYRKFDMDIDFNQTRQNKFHWNSNHPTKISVHKNAFEDVYKILATLLIPDAKLNILAQWVFPIKASPDPTLLYHSLDLFINIQWKFSKIIMYSIWIMPSLGDIHDWHFMKLPNTKIFYNKNIESWNCFQRTFSNAFFLRKLLYFDSNFKFAPNFNQWNNSLSGML